MLTACEDKLACLLIAKVLQQHLRLGLTALGMACMI